MSDDENPLRMVLLDLTRDIEGACAFCGSKLGVERATMPTGDLVALMHGYCRMPCQEAAGTPVHVDVEEWLRRRHPGN